MGVNKLLYRNIDTVGDGSGDWNITGNYTDGGVDPLGATEFKLTASPNEHIHVERVLVSLADTGTFDSGGYGNGSALTTGINAYVTDKNGLILYRLIQANNPIKTNGDWAHKCYDLTLHAFGSGDQYLAARWTFARSGQPVILRPGWSLIFLFQDSFAHLVDHHYELQGFFMDRGVDTDEGHA